MKNLSYKILTNENWNDFENLLGSKGACGGCWCMYWRLSHKEFELNKGDKNKALMRSLVDNQKQIGLIQYFDSKPIGWCSFASREDFPRLANSRILKPIDEKKVWAIVCFFVDKNFRKKGYSVELLKSVIHYLKSKNEKIVEGYPVDSEKKSPDVFMYTGLLKSFLKAGFVEVGRNSPTRPIMRYYLG